LTLTGITVRKKINNVLWHNAEKLFACGREGSDLEPRARLRVSSFRQVKIGVITW